MQSTNKTHYRKQFGVLLYFKDFIQISEEDSVWIETSSYIKWYYFGIELYLNCAFYFCFTWINITYFECGFVALGNQYALRMRYIVVCGLPDSTVFFYVFSYTVRYSKKKSYGTLNVCVEFSHNIWQKHFILRTEQYIVINAL